MIAQFEQYVALVKKVEFLNLPLPPAILGPNSRKTWMEKQSPKTSFRDGAQFIAKTKTHTLTKTDRIKVYVNCVFSRKRDLDNTLSALKSTIDGLFLGLGLNDNQIESIEVSRSSKKDALGYVDIYIYAMMPKMLTAT